MQSNLMIGLSAPKQNNILSNGVLILRYPIFIFSLYSMLWDIVEDFGTI